MKKWLLRILIAMVVIAGLGLLSLQILSGTSDSQKRGLEQAFSTIFRGDASFGTLKTFNLFPHTVMAVENLRILRDAGASVQADEMSIGFGAGDLILKNRRIEVFHLKNFKMSAGFYLPFELSLTDAGLYAGDTKDKGKFAFEGFYGGQALKGQIDMWSAAGTPPKYSFEDDNKFTINLGSFQLSGDLAPYVGKGGEIKNLRIFTATKAGKKNCDMPADKSIPSGVFFYDVLAGITKIKDPSAFDAYCKELQSAP